MVETTAWKAQATIVNEEISQELTLEIYSIKLSGRRCKLEKLTPTTAPVAAVQWTSRDFPETGSSVCLPQQWGKNTCVFSKTDAHGRRGRK